METSAVICAGEVIGPPSESNKGIHYNNPG